MRVGVFVSETWGAPSPIAQVGERAAQAEELGFATVWVPYLPWAVDALTAAHTAGLATTRVEVGTAVVPTYLFHPLAMARQAFTVDEAIGNRLTLGVGPSQPSVIERMHGIAFDRPAKQTEEYVRVLRAAAAGTSRVEFAGEVFAVDAMFGVPAVDVTRRAGLPILVGALGRLMLDVAGTYADGTIATSSDEGAIERVIGPGVRAAAARAGRPEPRVGAVLAVAVVPAGQVDEVRATMATHFANYERIPRYARMLHLGDKATMGEVHICGDEATVRRRLAAFASAGLTDLVAAPFSWGADPEASRRPTLEVLADFANRGT